MGPLTLEGLVLIALLFVIIIAGYYFVRVLKNAAAILLSLKKIMEANVDNINKMMNDFPAIVENVTGISGDAQKIVESLKEEQKVVDGVLKDVSETVGSVSATAQAINEDVFSKVKALVNAMVMVLNMIIKRSKFADSSQFEDDASTEGLSPSADFSAVVSRFAVSDTRYSGGKSCTPRYIGSMSLSCVK